MCAYKIMLFSGKKNMRLYSVCADILIWLSSRWRRNVWPLNNYTQIIHNKKNHPNNYHFLNEGKYNWFPLKYILIWQKSEVFIKNILFTENKLVRVLIWSLQNHGHSVVTLSIDNPVCWYERLIFVPFINLF